MQASTTISPSLTTGAPRFEPGERIAPGLLAWERLGDGRTCESWLAWSLPLWTHVVVKLPRDGRMDDARVVRRLGREGRLLRRLSHPAIQRLLEDAHRHAVPHLLLEYVEGPTLESLVEEHGPLDPGDVLRVGMQLGACLHYMHSLGLVHLDVKPGNVALVEGRAVLLDLDIARAAGRAAPRGRPRGTRAYMAPEQCRRERVDPAMDLFGLGAVLYELATGAQAFLPGPEGSDSEHPQLRDEPRRAVELRPSLPERLDAAIHALLEPEMDRRPHTAMDALRLLAAALPGDEEGTWPSFVDGALAGARQSRSPWA